MAERLSRSKPGEKMIIQDVLIFKHAGKEHTLLQSGSSSEKIKYW